MDTVFNRVVSICRRVLQRPPVSDTEFARQHIRNELRRDCDSMRIAQAQARAQRLINANVERSIAIRRAIVWARGAHNSFESLAS